MPSLLELTEALDSFEVSDGIYRFISHDGVEIGYILPMVAEAIREFPDTVIVDHFAKTVKIGSRLSTFEARNEAFAKIASEWRAQEKFESLKGWRDELYVVYNPTHTPYLLIERAFSCLLGVITYGVHINGYIPSDLTDDGCMRLWIPRRSYQKPTCPGQLDNTVAGGIGYPYAAYETCIKECSEEAGLEESFTKKNLKAKGSVSYIYQKIRDLEDEQAVVQPEVEYVYDLVFDKKTVPKPVDGEVHEFYLLTVDEVLEKLKAGEFKYNCAGVIIDFLFRHNILSSTNEKDYSTIISKLHRNLPFPSI